ncbi:MAG TPA: tetratricopeptide repeat protein [Myxococcota bacterium]|jgi:tetratricopeptide (TPR) repeat protein|nr:tetratricopeptide repeat protein [Myxococcota bacterium]
MMRARSGVVPAIVLALVVLGGAAAHADAAAPAAGTGAPVALPAVEIPPEAEGPPEVPTTIEEMGAAHEALRRRLVDVFKDAKERLDSLDADTRRIHEELAKLETLVGDLRVRSDTTEMFLDKRIPEANAVYNVATSIAVIMGILLAVFLGISFMLQRDIRRDIDSVLTHTQDRTIERVEDSLRMLKARTDEALERSLKSIESASEAEATALSLRTARTEVDGLRGDLPGLKEAVERLRRDLDHYARLEQADKNPRVLLVAAETARTHGEAILYLEQLVDLEASPDVLFSAAALAHQEFKSVPLAISLYEKGLEKAKDRVSARAVYLSLLAFMPERRDAAKAELLALARKYRDDTIYACLFNFFIRAGDEVGHRDAARALLEGGKASAIVHRNLALALSKTGGDVAEVTRSYDEAVRLDETGESVSAYVEWLSEQGRHADAEAVIRAALRKEPLNHECRVLLGRVRWGVGDLAGARAEYQKVVDHGGEADPLSARAARIGLEEVAMAELDRGAGPK